ncbi:MAG: hypothetical protein EPN82_08980 [Bacteroidetes bacterium]|nr:MAG: hypothetical protein EPN82_08980 [Bacteroidota bacterium]
MEKPAVRNVIRDTRREIKYVIYANKELNRDEMLKEIRKFNSVSYNIRQKHGSTIELIAED